MKGTNYLIPCKSTSGECNKSSSEPSVQARKRKSPEPQGGSLYSRDPHIVYDILLKLPVKSLLRFRCVGKVLCNIIDSPSFANKHVSTHAAAAEEPEFMYHYSPGRNVPMGLYSVRYDGNVMRANKYPFVEFSSRYYYSTHYLSYGLFCIHDGLCGGEKAIILFNPLRGEMMFLPQATASVPLSGPDYYGLGFDGTTDTYKIVHLFHHATATYKNSRYLELAAEVYTLGTKSWRRISSGGPPCKISPEGVSAYGDLHWQNIWTYPREYAEGMMNSSNLIISFDSRKEEFNWTPHPEVTDEVVYESIHLLNLKGSLAMACVLSPTALDIWVMKDYDTKEWARDYRVSIELWARERNNCPIPDPIRFVGAWEHGLYFDDCMEGNIYLYSLKTGCMQCVSYQPSTDDAEINFNYRISSYTGTLVSLKNYGHSVAAELGPGFSYVLNNPNLVYIFP